MIAYYDGSTPEQTLKDGYWVIIVHDENYNGSKTQYVYNASSARFIFAGEVSTVNDASSSIKGVLRLNGDLSGTADTPQLISTGVTEGVYNISGGSVTIDKKGRILNISVSTVREWEYSSLANTRITDVTTFTVPEYNLTSSILRVYWNGNLLNIGRDYEKTDITTITIKFNIRIIDDIYIVSEKNIGLFDIGAIINDNSSSSVTTYSSDKLESGFAKLNRSFNFNVDNNYDLGSTTYRVRDIYLANSPIVSSDKRYKLNIEKNDLGLDFILKLNPKKYQLQENGRVHRGLLAQDLKSILKNQNAMYVQNSETGIMGIRYEELIPCIILAIQELAGYKKEHKEKLKLSLRKRFSIRIKKFFKRKA